jgi:ABC-2 type transport system permease protein
VSSPQPWGAPLALIRRDYQERSTFRFAVALDLLFGILNLVVFFYISRVLHRPSSVQLHGAHTYFAFAAVGIAYMLVIGAAAASLARRLREEQLTGTLEALCTQPLRSSSLAIGFASFPFLFAITRAAGYIVLADLWLGLGISNPDWLAVISLLAVSSVALVAIGIALSAVTVAAGRGSQITQVAVFAMGFLGGAYFPIALLPGWLQTLSYLTPTRYALDGLRAALYGGRWAGQLAVLAAFAALTLPLALVAFRAALGMSIRRGALTRL